MSQFYQSWQEWSALLSLSFSKHWQGPLGRRRLARGSNKICWKGKSCGLNLFGGYFNTSVHPVLAILGDVNALPHYSQKNSSVVLRTLCAVCGTCCSLGLVTAAVNSALLSKSSEQALGCHPFRPSPNTGVEGSFIPSASFCSVKGFEVQPDLTSK